MSKPIHKQTWNKVAETSAIVAPPTDVGSMMPGLAGWVNGNVEVQAALGAASRGHGAQFDAGKSALMAAALPTDTRFAQQWHLHNTESGEFDLNVVSVWPEFTGKGVRIMVIDDGFDHSHSDIAPNYDTSLDHDYRSGDNNAAAEAADDNHGTGVIGIIGAARNGTGVVGVAYGATLVGARINYDVVADVWTSNFVAALGDAVAKNVGVVNMSFGDDDAYDAYSGAANMVLEKAAIANAVANGREGLGIALVKSGGNNRAEGIDVNHNMADNNSAQIIVAAVDRNGYVSSYSSAGAALLVSAFGSPLAGEIVTTDRVGAAGYRAGSFMEAFNGTSAAAPMVSGVVALMEQANDQLGWRDIQSILASTARHVGSVIDGSTISGSELNPWHWNTATNWNGGGMHFSEDYGYGLVDTRAAVRLAESWTAQSTSANQQVASLDLLDVSTTLTDNDPTGTYFSGSMATDVVIERVTVTIDLSTTYTGDFELYLTGPDGRSERLIADQGSSMDYSGTYTLHTQAFRGESSANGWGVRVVDDGAGDPVVLSDIRIDAYGALPSVDDTFIYTNEFSDYTHSTVILDSDGGTDAVNASAVTSATTISLLIGTGKIDGVDVTLTGIENAYGGDGKDKISGDNDDNELAGGRGRDTLYGYLGADTFLYRTVADSVAGKGRDLIADFGKGGADILDLADIDTRANAAGDQAFRFIAAQDFHGKVAELGFDIINKAGTLNDMTLVSGDINGDKHADFQIQLTGIHHLTVSDFAL